MKTTKKVLDAIGRDIETIMIERATIALHRTWETIAGDYLALGNGKPISAKEACYACLDYVRTYGRDDEAANWLADLPTVKLNKLVKVFFTAKTYGY